MSNPNKALNSGSPTKYELVEETMHSSQFTAERVRDEIAESGEYDMVKVNSKTFGRYPNKYRQYRVSCYKLLEA